MVALSQAFDATAVEPSSGFDLLPVGKYLVQIIASEIKATKKGGEQLVLDLEIIDGPYKGRKLWDRLNLNCPGSPKAEEIAMQTLSAICHAVGKLSMTDSDVLHFQTMTASVKVKPAEGQYEAKNEIAGYSAAAGFVPGSVARPAVAASRPAATAPRPANNVTPIAAPSAPKSPPWAKR